MLIREEGLSDSGDMVKYPLTGLLERTVAIALAGEIKRIDAVTVTLKYERDCLVKVLGLRLVR